MTILMGKADVETADIGKKQGTLATKSGLYLACNGARCLAKATRSA